MMRHKRKNNKWRIGALWALLSLILIGAVPVSASSENAQNSEKGTVVFTERAISGGPYRVNVMLTKTISEEEVAAGQYNVRATIVERDAPDDAAASAVNATVYVTAGLQQSVTVYVGTVEDLKNAGAYFGEGDTGYGKTVKEPESAGWEGEEIPDPATGTVERDPDVDFEELPEEKKGLLEIAWDFRYLGISILVVVLALFGLPRFSGRDRGEDEEESAIWKD